MSFFHTAPDDAEWNEFVASNASGDGILLFGRVTYQMMASFWPTPQAHASMPAVAEGMNQRHKIVFSRTLADVTWSNTTLMKGDLVTEIRKLKETEGQDMVILGSGTLVAQLTPPRLIDEYQLVVNPLVIGKGRTMFDGITEHVHLKPTKSRAFRNGSMLLSYEPAK
jgi:dihydrofolate reductase